MKALYILNYFIVDIPPAMMLAGYLFEETLIYYGLWLTLLTGAFQVVVGIGMFIDSFFEHRLIQIYLAGVTLFFLFWFITEWEWLLVMPPALAIYMTVILYIEAKKANHEP